MKRKLLRCMTALTALLFASCSSDPYLSLISDNGTIGEEVDVTFSISTEDVQAMTRAGNVQGGGPGQWQNTIGKATQIDMLIYAVYDEDYTLLAQYGKGIIKNEESTTTDFEKFKSSSEALSMKDANQQLLKHNGQTIVYDPFLKDGKDEDGNLAKNEGTYSITLRLMRNKVYHIAFWAQSSETAAFNTDDLENVKVIYAGAKNNDELRDAFCKVETFSVSPNANPRSVVLNRPFAQINVGTTGADYKHLLTGKKQFPNVALTESQITISGVAQYLDVVKDEVKVDKNVESENAPTEVTFSFERIPAFMYMNEIPTDNDKLIGTDYAATAGEETESTESAGDEDEDDEPEVEDESEKEEFLKVDLDNNGTILPYKTDYPTLGDNNAFLTETFKYLSMCYVLVPASTNPEYTGDTPIDNDEIEDGDWKTPASPYYSTVLNSVKVSFKGTTNSGEEKEYASKIDLTGVPAQRNWRTNILCGLSPTTDDDPNDPSSVLNLVTVLVDRDPIFEGEYNTEFGSHEWTENKFPGNFSSGEQEDDDTIQY